MAGFYGDKQVLFFPENPGTKYYNSLWVFLKNAAIDAGIPVQLKRFPPRKKRGFVVKYCGYRILIDFGDTQGTAKDLGEFEFCFKYHYFNDLHRGLPNVFPLSPVSFLDWNGYRSHRARVEFQGRGKILNNQRPYQGSRDRRLKAQRILRRSFGKAVDFLITEQAEYLRKGSVCCCSVHIPGQRGTILDRAQLQMMGLGVCTVAPRIDITLSWWNQMVPGEDYIEILKDFSDLPDKIRWIQAHPEEAVKIGKSARELFEASCTPGRIWEWIEAVLSARTP